MPRVLFTLLFSTFLAVPTLGSEATDADLRRDLDEANALKDGDACEEAVIRYEELLGRLPAGSDLGPPARYNQAVCLEEMGLPEAALENHRCLADDAAAPDEIRRDARFREALIHIALDDAPRARRALRKLLSTLDASPMREVAWVHLAWLDIRAGRRRPAARRLAKAVPVLEAAHSVDDRQGLAVHLAVASVGMGDLIAHEALRPPLCGSAEQVRSGLARLAETAEAAQVHYIDAMRREHPTWAAAAALHLGILFTGSYERLVELRRRLEGRRPLGWSAAEARVVDFWLGERLEPTLLKARQAFRLCADIPLEVGEPNRFTVECDVRLGFPPFL